MKATRESSVVVVSYRPQGWLAPCLESVLPQAGEVIVVDNGSPDRQASTIAESSGARVVRSSVNLGFAGGVAAGLAAARGEIVGLLNDDATAGPGWIDSAAAVLADPSVAAVTPKVLLAQWYAEVALSDDVWFAPGDARPLGRQVRSITVGGREVLAAAVGAGVHDLEEGPGGSWRWTSGSRPFYIPIGWQEAAEADTPRRCHAGDTPRDADPPVAPRVLVDGEEVAPSRVVRVVNHAGSFLRGHGIAGEYGFGAPDDGRFDQPADRFGFSGTAPVIRAETLRRLDSFAPRFFAYNEDTDWCLRARLAGLRIVYDPGSTVEHRMNATSGGSSARLVRHLAQRNALLCLTRNAPMAVARPLVLERLRRGWADPVARDLAAKLPWALTSRLALSHHWVYDPADIWSRWADRDLTWDDAPAGRSSTATGAEQTPTSGAGYPGGP